MLVAVGCVVGLGGCGAAGPTGTAGAGGAASVNGPTSDRDSRSGPASGSVSEIRPGEGSAGRPSSGGGPTAYPPLVADATWVTREGERALVVTPTTYLRDHAQTDVAEEAWRRIVVAVPEADTAGMRDQFVCHAQFASRKDAWYLEPSRPAVGYVRTVAAGCNPGTPRDVG